jgi:LuxR family transcriptional regulator, maltose regulon positive regulatory protein
MQPVSEVVVRHVDAGHAALRRGEWEVARNAFEAALAVEETGEALEGLGLAAWWLDLADVVFDARERAYRLYHEQNNRTAAARVAVWLAWDTAAFRGEHAIATGWLQRARRLLDDQPPSAEHAWLALRSGVSALLHDGRPEEAATLAATAISVGEAIGSLDYAVAGRALHGYAEVTTGRVTEGLRTLDEVSASVLAGEVKDYVLMGLACCYLIAACDRIRDYDRAAQWCDRLKESCKKWGLRPLFAVCRTQYASVCMWRGAWDEAERELSAATDELAACRPAMTGEGLARLGELRRRQGKLDDAIVFFEKAGAHPMAALGRAMVAFDRGDLKAAADLSDRYLRKLPLQNRTERAAGLELLCRAQIELGNRVDAQKALEELRDIAARAQTDPLRASASFAAGIVLACSGDAAAAQRHLEDAVDLFQKGGAPFETARARVELARVLGTLDRSESAAAEIHRAIDELSHLQAELELSRAHDVRRSLSSGAGAQPLPVRRDERGGLTVRELEVLRLISVGLSNHAIAQRLFISEHTVHRHVANTLTKLNVSSRSAAVAQVARLGVL